MRMNGRMVNSLLAALLVGACATTSSLTVPATSADVPKASPDKAVIVFMRPSLHASNIGAVVLRLDADKEEFLTALDWGTKVAVAVPPGEYRFMIVNSFGGLGGMLAANVAPGKTYHVVGAPAGWPAVHFSLYPVKASTLYKWNSDSDDVKKWIAELESRRKAPGAEAWLTERGARVKAFRAKFEPEWNARTDNKADEFVLRPGDGR